MIKAAGIAFTLPDGKMLFLQRSQYDHEPSTRGQWDLPGGHRDGNETPEQCAVREAREELGWDTLNFEPPIDWENLGDRRLTRMNGGGQFATFTVNMHSPFIPTLSDEHTAWAWAPQDNPPQPLHRGVQKLLAQDQAFDELRLAFDAAVHDELRTAFDAVLAMEEGFDGAFDDFKEEEHKRGGDPKHPGRFSKGKGGGGKVTEAKPSLPEPTEKELSKAKKSVPLQLKYVSGPKTLSPEYWKKAQALIKPFNDKYANKQITDPDALKQKVQDFKDLKAKVDKLYAEFDKLGKGEVKPPAAKPPAPAAPAAAMQSTPAPATASLGLKEVLERSQTTEERKRHESEFAWKFATPNFMSAVARSRPLNTVKSIPNGATSFYNSAGHSISMAGDAKDTVWRHEFGHSMDYEGGQQKSAKYHNDMKTDANDLLAHLNEPQAGLVPFAEGEFKQRAAKLGLSSKEATAFGGQRLFDVLDGKDFSKATLESVGKGVRGQRTFLDFIGALTVNKIGVGHTNQYYMGPGKRETEMFANYVSMTQGQDGQVWKQIAHAVAPRTMKGFDKIIDDMAKRPKQQQKMAA